MNVTNQASRPIMIQEEVTGKTEGPAEPVTTTVGPWWLSRAGCGGFSTPVRILPFYGCSVPDGFVRFVFRFVAIKACLFLSINTPSHSTHPPLLFIF